MSLLPPINSGNASRFMNNRVVIYAPAGITSETGFGFIPDISGSTPVTSNFVLGNLQEMSANRITQYKGYNDDELFELYLPLKDPTGNSIEIELNNLLVIDSVQYIPIASGKKLGDRGTQMIPVRKTEK